MCEEHVILPLKILLPCNFQPQAWTDHRHKAPKLYVLSLSRPVDSCVNKANIYCVRSTSTAEYSSEIEHNTQQASPFGVQQVPDFLVIYFHIRDFHGEALFLSLVLYGSLKQRTAESGDQTGLVHRTHHGVRLSRAWEK